MPDWRPHATALADSLAASGAVRDSAWRDAVASTPRHLFVPRFYVADEYGQPRHLVDATDRWDAIYQDQVLVTRYQTAGTMPDGQEVRVPTSSASMPSVVATMLDRLAVAAGHQVLEIGTGTGWNAALLCHRLGPSNVTTIELDEATAAEAAEHLAAAGHHPAQVVGDGAAGWPPNAPYDRIIATCAVGRIPAAWIAQLAPGGRIVSPLTWGCGLAVLDRGADGVTGHLDTARVGFMPLRPAAAPATTLRRTAGLPQTGLTAVDPRLLDPTGPHDDFRLWVQLHQPADATVALACDDDGTSTGLILHTDDARAEAAYDPAEQGLWPVTQTGATRLWDTVEAAWQSWQRGGQPHRTRIGITARGGGQWAWLDDPDGPLRWPLPG